MHRISKIILASLLAFSATTNALEENTKEKIKEEPVPQTEEDGATSSSFFRYYVKNIPHNTKREKGGEDAWVASSNLLVVADGVGGWARHGIDAGLFSKQLVHNIKEIYDENEA